MILSLIPWFFIGVIAAAFNYATRLWTVMRIQPGKKVSGMTLVFSGAFIRLLIVGFLLYSGLQVGIFPTLAAFFGIWVMRWVLAISSGRHMPRNLKPQTTIGS